MTLHTRIFGLALPNILSNITVPLLGMVDLTLAGHLRDTSVIGAVAISTTLFSLLYWGFSFLRMGTTGLTAQACGTGDDEAQGRILSQSLCISIVAALLILMAQSPIRIVALRVLSPDPSLIGPTTTYYDYVIWGAPAMLLTYALNGWIIGMQNTWWPMVTTITSNLVNIIVSSLLVTQYHMGIDGIALGTLVAQWTSAIMLIAGAYYLFLRTGTIPLAVTIQSLTHGFGSYFGTNIHIFFRTLLLAAVSVFFTYSGTHQGPIPLAANALLYQFFTFFSYFIDGFAYAAEAIVGHSYGRHDRSTLTRAIKIISLWGGGLALLVSIIYTLFGHSFIGLLTDNAEVLAYAHQYLRWVYLLPLCGFTAFLMDGIFVGLTATRSMLMSMAAAVAVFFGLYYFVPLDDTNTRLWMAFVTYLLIRGMAQWLLLLRMPGVWDHHVVYHTYYISVGSTRTGSAPEITQLLTQHFPTGQLSPYYTTPDATGHTDTVYLNAVLMLHSTMEIDQVVDILKEIERTSGRDRSHPHEVALDLDLVLDGDRVLRPKDYSRPYFQIGYQALTGNSTPGSSHSMQQ